MGQTDNLRLFAGWQEVPTCALKPGVVPIAREHVLVDPRYCRWSSIGSSRDEGRQ